MRFCGATYEVMLAASFGIGDNPTFSAAVLRRLRDSTVHVTEGLMSNAVLVNGANGMSDIEGKAAREAVSECGQRASFNGASREAAT